MTEQAASTQSGQRRSSSGLLYAVLGAVVMTVFSWIPFAPVVGGAVSGYLEATQPGDGRSASSRGLRVGALAGLVATLPAALVIALVASVFTAGFLGMGASGGLPMGVSLGFGVLGVVVVVFALIALAVYHAGLGALGGWLGAMLAADRGDAIDTHAGGDSTTGTDQSVEAEPVIEDTRGETSETDGDDDRR